MQRKWVRKECVGLNEMFNEFSFYFFASFFFWFNNFFPSSLDSIYRQSFTAPWCFHKLCTGHEIVFDYLIVCSLFVYFCVVCAFITVIELSLTSNSVGIQFTNSSKSKHFLCTKQVLYDIESIFCLVLLCSDTSFFTHFTFAESKNSPRAHHLDTDEN